LARAGGKSHYAFAVAAAAAAAREAAAAQPDNHVLSGRRRPNQCPQARAYRPATAAADCWLLAACCGRRRPRGTSAAAAANLCNSTPGARRS